MSTAQKWKYALLGAALPTVAVGALLVCAGVAVRFVSGMGPRDIARKTENYAALCEDAPEDSTVFSGTPLRNYARLKSCTRISAVRRALRF